MRRWREEDKLNGPFGSWKLGLGVGQNKINKNNDGLIYTHGKPGTIRYFLFKLGELVGLGEPDAENWEDYK